MDYHLEYDIIEFLDSIVYPDVDDQMPNREKALILLNELEKRIKD